VLADYARRIRTLEARIDRANEDAEQDGDVELPASVYADLDELSQLREQAASATIESNDEAIMALGLVAAGHECAEARLVRNVMAYLAGK
jgi:hypothetical protein